MATTQRTDLRRRADALLDAAAALLAETGAGGLRIEDVAERAGVGKGTVYLHWESRRHLLLAVAAREAAAVYGSIVDAIRADPTEAALHRCLRRSFLETMRRPVLRSVFIADETELGAFARQPARSEPAEIERLASLDHLAALRRHRLLRPGPDLAEIDYAVQAIAYGFFSAPPLLPDRPRFTVEHRAEQLAEVVRRSFEPARRPAPERYAAAAPRAAAALEHLADGFRRAAYGSAAD